MIFKRGWDPLQYLFTIAPMPGLSCRRLNSSPISTNENTWSRWVLRLVTTRAWETEVCCLTHRARSFFFQINSSGVSSSDLPPPISQRNCIQLAACAANQILPMNPELPADLFTACLTTPIKMALRWFVMQNHGMLATNISLETLERIPGNYKYFLFFFVPFNASHTF